MIIQHKLVIEPKAIIQGFCWEYSHALLEKMHELVAQERIFEDGEGNSPSNNEQYRKLSDIAYVTISALKDQMVNQKFGVSMLFSDVENYLMMCKEFLSIFHEK